MGVVVKEGGVVSEKGRALERFYFVVYKGKGLTFNFLQDLRVKI